MKTINDKIALGAFWSLLTRVIIKSLGLVSTVILARLLWPEDFGLVAIAMMMLAFFQIFTSFGFDINIIQKDEVTDETLNSAWTCKVLSGLVLAIVLFLGSHWAGLFFEDERLPLLISVIAFIPLLNGLENIGFVLFRKELDLKKEFKLEVVTKIVSFSATIAAAFLLKSYWALVIGMYVSATTRVAMSFLMHSYVPAFSLKEAKDLFSFSKWLLLSNVLIFLNHKITDLILAKQVTPAELGYYTVGYEVSNLPTTELVFPLSRAIFPGYSKLKNDLSVLKDTFIKFTKVVMLFASPICFGMMATASELVNIFLGDKWVSVIPLIAFLSMYGLMRSAVQNTGNIILALGRPQILVVLSLTRLFLIVPLLLYLVPEQGALGASKAILLVTSMTVPLAYVITARLISIRLIEIVEIFFFPLVSSICMYFLVVYVGGWLTESFDLNTAILLLSEVMVGVIFYLMTLIFYCRLFPRDNVIISVFEKARVYIRLRAG